MCLNRSRQGLNQSTLTHIYCMVTADINKHGKLVHNKEKDILTLYGPSEQEILQQLQKLYPDSISIIVAYPTLHIALDSMGNIKCIISTFKDGTCLLNSDDLLDHIASIERLKICMKYEMSLPIKYFMSFMKNGINTMSKFAALTEYDLDKMGINSKPHRYVILRYAKSINIDDENDESLSDESMSDECTDSFSDAEKE